MRSRNARLADATAGRCEGGCSVLPRLSHPAADNFVFSRSSNWAVFGVNKDSSKFL